MSGFKKYLIGAVVGLLIGLWFGVNIGHGLTLENLKPIIQVKGIEIDEASIGFSIISNAVLNGLQLSVEKYIQMLKE